MAESEAVRHEGAGLFASLRRMLATLVELVHARLELVGTELQLEVQRATNVLLWAFAAIVLGIVAVVLLAVTVLIAFWDTHLVARRRLHHGELRGRVHRHRALRAAPGAYVATALRFDGR